ncbi:unnamed protein product, partial [Rotaria magnacalcarata]
QIFQQESWYDENAFVRNIHLLCNFRYRN